MSINPMDVVPQTLVRFRKVCASSNSRILGIRDGECSSDEISLRLRAWESFKVQEADLTCIRNLKIGSKQAIV